jgi:hypothetical protein
MMKSGEFSAGGNDGHIAPPDGILNQSQMS